MSSKVEPKIWSGDTGQWIHTASHFHHEKRDSQVFMSMGLFAITQHNPLNPVELNLNRTQSNPVLRYSSFMSLAINLNQTHTKKIRHCKTGV